MRTRLSSTSLLIVLALAICAGAAVAAATVDIALEGDRRCIRSDGTPNHPIGDFPNPGNPHRFTPQDLEYCMPASPQKTERARTARESGVLLNGVPIRPGTADWYDANSPRGHSRDPSSGWNLEGMGSGEALGLDQNNAHVDHRGLYHYHGPPIGFLRLNEGSLIGYAADGFEIHYVGAMATPSWRLKTGQRPTAPFGAYDGQYEEDFVHDPAAGNLDRCNGGEIDGRFVYFATDAFPFYPRCFWGEVSADFAGGQGERQGRSDRRRPPRQNGLKGHFRRPPPRG
ncbi:MAG: YHYH protein [Pseudomonadota bacterium]